MNITAQVVDRVIELSEELRNCNILLDQKYGNRKPFIDLSEIGKYDNTVEGAAVKQAEYNLDSFLNSLSYEEIIKLVALMYLGRGDGIAAGATDLYEELDEDVAYAKSHFNSEHCSVAVEYLEEKYPLAEYLLKAKSLVPSAILPTKEPIR